MISINRTPAKAFCGCPERRDARESTPAAIPLLNVSPRTDTVLIPVKADGGLLRRLPRIQLLPYRGPLARRVAASDPGPALRDRLGGSHSRPVQSRRSFDISQRYPWIDLAKGVLADALARLQFAQASTRTRSPRREASSQQTPSCSRAGADPRRATKFSPKFSEAN